MKIVIICLFFVVTINLSQTAEDYYQGGKNKYDKFDYTGSINDFNKAIELKPIYLDAFLNRGKSFYMLEQYEKANEDFSIVIELNPDDFEHYNIRGSSFFHLHQYENAIIDFSKAIDLKPDNGVAYHNRGLSKAVGLLDTIGACIDFNKALELGYNPEICKKYLDLYCK